MSVRITCIKKDNGNHQNPYLVISHLGWVDEKTRRTGIVSRLDMYNFIKKEGGQAYVVDKFDNSKAYLEALINAAGTKFVRTMPNDTGRDNLLSLPEC